MVLIPDCSRKDCLVYLWGNYAKIWTGDTKICQHFNKLLAKFFVIIYWVPFQSVYDEMFLNTVYQSDVVTLDELKRGLVKTKNPVRITYLTKEQYKRATKSLGLMDDFKVISPKTLNIEKRPKLPPFSEWSPPHGVPRRRFVLLQRAAGLPGAKHQLEGLRSHLELTASADCSPTAAACKF